MAIDDPMTRDAETERTRWERPVGPDRDDRPSAPPWLRDGIAALEGDARLDPVVGALEPLSAAAGRGAAGRFLGGDWLGHALHPVLTDVVVGCWTSATVLDLVGGRSSRPAARRLIGAGLLTAPGTVASGLAELGGIGDQRDRRVAAVHAVGNGAAVLAYVASWRARGRGHHVRGIGWALAGGAVASVTGYLGGHLSFARSVGTGERGLHLREA